MMLFLTSLNKGGTQIASEIVVWQWAEIEIRLEISYFVTDTLPDFRYVTSVRGIVLRQSKVLVVKNSDEVHHIIPGGRLEPGETLLEGLAREISEETGWTIVQPRLLGVMHFLHLTPCPEKYPYPCPEFLQVVYVAHAEALDITSKKIDDYETDAAFMAFDEALKLPIADGQKAYLFELKK